MLSHEGRSRSYRQNAALAVTLSGVAGAVNATGFLAVGTYTSHVTGNVARIGDELAQGRIEVARSVFFMVIAFLVGAMVATVLVEVARRRSGRGHYTAALLVEATILGVFAALVALPTARPPELDLVLTLLLCAAMGLQNALVTKISGAIVRTTHLTGVTTDFGIELVRLFFWWRDGARGGSPWRQVLRLRGLVFEPELRQAWLHFGIFWSFFAGAVAGPALYLHWGPLTMGLPGCALLCLVAFDQWSRQQRPAHAPARL